MINNVGTMVRCESGKYHVVTKSCFITRYFHACFLPQPQNAIKYKQTYQWDEKKGSELLGLKLTKWMYGRLVFTASSRICFYEHSSVGLKWIFILPHPVFRIKSEHNRKPFSDHLESHAIKKPRLFIDVDQFHRRTPAKIILL